MRATALLAVVLAAYGYVLGYWVIGYGFARGPAPGMLGILLTLTAAALVIVGACWRRPSWRSWLGYRARTALACCVAAAALSAGATLGSTGLVPACPAPAELRVLTSAEDLAAIQAAIPGFEQYEPAHLHTACYAVDVTGLRQAGRQCGRDRDCRRVGHNRTAHHRPPPRPSRSRPHRPRWPRSATVPGGRAADPARLGRQLEWFLSWPQFVQGSALHEAVEAGPGGSTFVDPATLPASRATAPLQTAPANNAAAA